MSEFFQFMITHLWESSLFGIVCCGLIFALGKSWSFSRHLLAWSAIVKFLIPLSVFSWSFDLAKDVVVEGTTEDVAGVGANMVNSYIGNVSEALRIEAWLNFEAVEETQSAVFFSEFVVLWVWVMGFFVITYFWIRQYRRINTSIIERCEEVGSDWQGLAESIWEKPQNSMPRILIAADKSLVAGVFGIRRHVVIIPTSFSLALNEEERMAFLLHEFQHIYKRDNLWLFAQKFIRNLFWIHPLVWWLDRQISAEREIMRDEEVIRKTNNVTSYLNCLMKVSNIKLPRNYVTSVGIKGSPFARRVKSIGRIKVSRFTDWLSAAGSITAILVLTFFLSTTLSISSLQAAEERNEPSMSEKSIEDWKAEINELSANLVRLREKGDDLARELREKEKAGETLSEPELEEFEEIKKQVLEIRDRLVVKSNNAAEVGGKIREIEESLEKNEFANEDERKKVLQRLEKIKDGERIYEPKVSENEKFVFKEVLGLVQTDEVAALELLKETIDEDSSAPIYYLSGVLYLKVGDKEMAIESLRVALDKFPNFRRAALILGKIQANAERFSDAKVNLLKALSLGAEDGLIYGLLGLCYLKTDDIVTAEHYYRIALDKNPENEDWWRGFAHSLIEQGKSTEL